MAAATIDAYLHDINMLHVFAVKILKYFPIFCSVVNDVSSLSTVEDAVLSSGIGVFLVGCGVASVFSVAIV